MADIFISYKSERRAAAWHLSQILELNGYTVWYDYGLLSGRDFSRRIEKELRAAKVVIVLWCPMSRDSDWVNNEALLARRLQKYVPVWIEETELPLEFIRDDTIDLKRWNGSPRSHDLDRLWDEIARLTEKEQAPDMRGIRQFEATWRGYGSLSMTEFALEATENDVQETPIVVHERKPKPRTVRKMPQEESRAQVQQQSKPAKNEDVKSPSPDKIKPAEFDKPDNSIEQRNSETVEQKEETASSVETAKAQPDEKISKHTSAGDSHKNKVWRLQKNQQRLLRNLKNDAFEPVIWEEEYSLDLDVAQENVIDKDVQKIELETESSKLFFQILLVLIITLLLLILVA